MATIKPFAAVRPKEGMENVISALPYDVYNREEAKAFVTLNTKSFLKIDRAESQFPDDVDTYDARVYKKASDMYEEMKETGEFVPDEKPFYYIYEQTMNGRKQTGLVCTCLVDDYLNGVIKKHENTRADKEVDRINHVDTLSAQTGPIFLSYRDNAELSSFFKSFKAENEAYFDFISEDGIEHKGWKIVKDEDIAFLTKQFSKIPNLYIADGHHRCASAAKVCLKRRESAGKVDLNAEYNYFLSVVFPDSELMIMDYNRVVRDLNGNDCVSLLNNLSKVFDITEKEVNDDKPSKKGDIFMLISDKEYVLSVKPEFVSNDPIDGLDVSILQNNVLKPIFGIDDPKTDKRIDFVGGIRGVSELRRRLTVDGKVAFAMYPTQMSELFAVADANLLMPPKSTWFEPKLRSGLFIHEFERN